MKAPSKKKDLSTGPAQIFLSRLKGGREIPLKHIARARYFATGGRQEALLTSLRRGEIVASAFWPTSAMLTDLPKELWADIPPNRFQVRKKKNGSWHSYTFLLPNHYLLHHVMLPLVRRFKDERLQPSDKEKLISNCTEMLESKVAQVSVCVTLNNARVYADTYLGGASSDKQVGRPKSLDPKVLLLEAFRRLHFQSLPSQKQFIGELTDWWNSDLNRKPCSVHWVEKHVKEIWSTLRPSAQK